MVEKHIKFVVSNAWQRWRVTTFYDKEPETIEWIRSFQGGSFWDIGANIGLFSLWCAHKHPAMTVHAFEPMRENYENLLTHITLNNHFRTMGHAIALGATGWRLAEFKTTRPVAGASGGQIDREVPDAQVGYLVPSTNGDVLRDSLGQPAYVKIDTDGNEFDILSGMPSVLADLRLKSVLVEVNNHKREISELMGAAGMSLDARLMGLKDRPTDHNVIYSREADDEK